MKTEIDDVLERMKLLEIDHTPDGWPAIQTKEVTAMRDEILRLRKELTAQRAGMRDVLTCVRRAWPLGIKINCELSYVT